MKAIQLNAFGNPEEVLQQVDIPEPAAPGPGQVLIEMLYAPVNFSDLLMAMGVYLVRPELPAVTGVEGVGKILELGDGVTGVAVGDHVTLPFGTYAWAQKVISPAEGLFVLNQKTDLMQAAMLTVNPPTAVLLVDEYASLDAGDWVLFNAANSAVGHALVALARSRGLKTAGIVRRPEAADQLLKAGADVVLVDGPDIVEEMKAATGGAAIKLALDAVGGEAANTLSKIIGPGGHIVVYALMSKQPLVIDQGQLIGKNIKLHGFWMYYDPFRPKLQAAMTEMEQLILSGALDIGIAAVYPLSQIKEAIRHTLKGGKVLFDLKL